MSGTTNGATSRYRYPAILLRQMVITDFKLRYQGSLLGYFWSLLKPLALFSILYVVFVQFLKIGGDLPNFPVYLLLGIVLWSYFTEVTSQGIRAILDRSELLRKVNFPRYVIVLAVAMSSLINLMLNLVVVAVFLVFTGGNLSTVDLWVPLLIVELFVLTLSSAFILSALYIRFRDLIYIWEVFLQAAFYATPIIYPLDMVPVDIAKWLILNPVAQILQDMRYALVTTKTQTIEQLYGSSLWRLIPVLIVVILGLIALKYFRNRSKYLAEEV